jgi:demethylmenaquinone methyltransferase/2-methoxy-6-polyprenyl-1,4-benzoquinol methylase
VTIEPIANAAGFATARDDVFARIAGRYDLLCDLFSLGAHRFWKAAMARRIAELPGAAILDLASGTGDIPLRLSRRLGADAGRSVTVTDICPQMLEIAARKLEGAKAVGAIALADAERLDEIDSDAFDVVSIAFGMKICDRGQVAREALRVLRPGGRFLCLEAARIPLAPLHGLYLAYMRLCMPLIAEVATGGDRSAYDYLVRGVHDFPDQRSFAAELSAAGYEAVAFRNLTFGIVALHEGRKPAWRGGRSAP